MKKFIMILASLAIIFIIAPAQARDGNNEPADEKQIIPIVKGITAAGDTVDAIPVTQVGNPPKGEPLSPEEIRAAALLEYDNLLLEDKNRRKAAEMAADEIRRQQAAYSVLINPPVPPETPETLAIDRQRRDVAAGLGGIAGATKEGLNQLNKTTGDGFSRVENSVNGAGERVGSAVDGVAGELKRNREEATPWYPKSSSGKPLFTGKRRSSLVRHALTASLSNNQQALESSEGLILQVAKDGTVVSETLTAIGQLVATKRGNRFVVYLDKLRIEGPSGERYEIDDMDGRLVVRDYTMSIHVPVIFPSGETRLAYIDLADNYYAACNYPGVALEFVTQAGVVHPLMRTKQNSIQRDLNPWKGLEREAMYKKEGGTSRYNHYEGKRHIKK